MAEKYDWSFENSISYTKEKLDLETHPHKYSSWRTNSYFSNFPDTVLIANQMNGLYNLDPDIQYRYYTETVRKRKRFFKKEKLKEEQNFTLVRDAYKYNVVKTREALKVLTESDIEMLQKLQEKGGT